MARMIQAAEMKVKHANEIVKYLQLELENYKEAYDIFGPN
jgi:FtsZ-binding cell division protein ZapB